MLRTVQFNGKFCFRTVKIQNIVAKDFLPCKCNTKCLSVGFKIVIPKVFFLFGHVFSQFFCKGNILFIMYSIHKNYLIRLVAL